MQKFIDLGWHTVPLKGELRRLENGDKTIPQFSKGWRVTYSDKFNKKATAIGGVITGEKSNIIAIDCDNKNTFAMFKAMDPDYEAVFVSKGKDAGTFIYNYEPGIDTHSPTDDLLALDVYSNNGFVYLPTEANKSKVTWDVIHKIKDMPATTRIILHQLQKRNAVAESRYENETQTKPCLNPLLTQFIGKRGEFIPSLFKIITPRAFRELAQYQEYGYLHPDSIPEGRGSEYLSQVSAILGADESVDHELYMDCMMAINELFETPMEDDRLDTTICNPMIEGNSSIAGVAIWKYNEFWSEKRLTVLTKHGLIVDLGFDDTRNMYYFIDMTNEVLRPFNRDTDFISYLDVTLTTVLPKKAGLKKSIPLIHIRSDPSEMFGFCHSPQPQVLAFNSFKRTRELSILHDHKDYEKFYNRPVNTIRYLECLVPDKDSRDFLLGFIKRKLMYFEYSPIILYFLGVPGSGKDTFVQILETIMAYMARPSTNEFLEKYNSWLLDTYFVQLDEYGDQLTRQNDKDMVKGLLKAYTGKPSVMIRDMRQSAYPVKHALTFIMTANKNPLMPDEQDRRIHLMETPNMLELQSWFSSSVHDAILAEIKDFCYYLATEIPMMSKDAYMSPPKSKGKHKLIADSMYAAQKIAYALEHNMVQYLVDLAEDNNVPEFAKDIVNGSFSKGSLEMLYDEMTDYKGDAKTVAKILRKKGFSPIVKTINNAREYIYHLKDNNPFSETEDE